MGPAQSSPHQQALSGDMNPSPSNNTSRFARQSAPGSTSLLRTAREEDGYSTASSKTHGSSSTRRRRRKVSHTPADAASHDKEIIERAFDNCSRDSNASKELGVPDTPRTRREPVTAGESSNSKDTISRGLVGTPADRDVSSVPVRIPRLTIPDTNSTFNNLGCVNGAFEYPRVEDAAQVRRESEIVGVPSSSKQAINPMLTGIDPDAGSFPFRIPRSTSPDRKSTSDNFGRDNDASKDPGVPDSVRAQQESATIGVQRNSKQAISPALAEVEAGPGFRSIPFRNPRSGDGSPTVSLVRRGHAMHRLSQEAHTGSDQCLKQVSPELDEVAGNAIVPMDVRLVLTSDHAEDFHLSSGAQTEASVGSPKSMTGIPEQLDAFSAEAATRSRRVSSGARLRRNSQEIEGDFTTGATRKLHQGSTASPEGVPVNGSRLTKGLAKPGFHFGKSSQLLEWPAGIAPSILYAREPDPSETSATNGAIPTQLAKMSFESDQRDLVYGDAAFHVKVVGLQIIDLDEPAASSFAKLGLVSPSSTSQRHRVLYSSRKDSSEGVNTVIPAIHYDSIRRESRNKLRRDHIHIPPDRGLVARSRGGSEVLNLALHFVLFQIQDETSKNTVRPTLDNVDALNEILNALSCRDAPYYSLLAPFIRVAGGLGNAALEQAGCTNRIIDTHVSFRLMSRDPLLNPRRSEVRLRYGYYFVLSEPCGHKLFTQVEAMENIRLYTRKAKDGTLHATKNLSYVVIRVSEQLRLPSESEAPPAGILGNADAQPCDVRAVPEALSPARTSARKSHCQGMFPPLQDALRDVDDLRRALNDARDAPHDEFRDRILALLDNVKYTR
jgi:hypothetical protein